ncbi:MAG TPA: hypothetical protein VG939_18360, partial [Caulobacteraceae bacterium]|nr:hypothetical protein [Caulobacteraceae bacterium]
DRFSPDLVDAFHSSFDPILTRGAGAIGVFDDEVGIVDEFDRMLQDLQHSRRPWRVAHGGFQFVDNADLDVFRAHQAAIMALRQKEDTAAADERRHVDAMPSD